MIGNRDMPILIIGFIAMNLSLMAVDGTSAKDNGDIYIVNETKFIEDKILNNITTPVPVMANVADTTMNSNAINNAAEVMALCNASFSIPMDYIIEFHNTGELPDIIDKTGMCFVRCFFEKSGLIDNWKLNTEKVRQNIWPATGDSIEHCEQEKKKEINACVRTYAIAKCLMIRAIVDARNKPMK